MADLVHKKNIAYGDASGKTQAILKTLFPDGVPVESYKDMLLMIRCFDKFSRIATNNDEFGESPWKDIMGYAMLAIEEDMRNGT